MKQNNKKQKKSYINPSKEVNFNLSSKQNKGRKLTLRRIEELNKFTKKQQEKIFKENLTTEHKKEIEEFGKKAVELVKDIGKPTLEAFKEPLNRLPTMSPLLFEKDLKITSPSKSEYQIEQIKLLKQIAEANKDKGISKLVTPSYDHKKQQLIFCNTIIEIPPDTDQEGICKALFKKGKPVKEPAQIGELLQEIGVPQDRLKGNKKVHYAKRELNDRVARATQINDLFVIKTKQIWFNEKYL